MPEFDPKIWMKALPDCWPLTGLSLPGTHNSATWDKSSLCTILVARPCCLCQDRYLREQLEDGIRVFDIRPAFRSRTHFYIWHGDIPLMITLDDVLEIFAGFLINHPSEAILLMHKCHWDLEFCGEEFVDFFKEKLVLFDSKYPNLFYPSPYGEYPDKELQKSPSLGEARGKIVLVNQMYYHSHLASIPSLVNFVGNRIENTWKFDEDKWHEYHEKLWKHILNAKDNITEPSCGDDNFWITWLSGNNCHLWPSGSGPGAIAREVNPAILKNLVEYSKDLKYRPSGIIMMDFPTKELINHLISENYLIMFRNNKDGVENCKFYNY